MSLIIWTGTEKEAFEAGQKTERLLTKKVLEKEIESYNHAIELLINPQEELIGEYYKARIQILQDLKEKMKEPEKEALK